MRTGFHGSCLITLQLGYIELNHVLSMSRDIDDPESVCEELALVVRDYEKGLL